ncbi:MAG: alpha/beta fold hydrolase [Porticoccaceae bacterium]|nr:alpha/beta fold hydrolase [Porticoccaceae bacterium]
MILMQVIALTASILVIILLLGPRLEIDTTLKPVFVPDDLELHIEKSESKFNDIVPGSEKTIIWHSEKGQKTAFSVVSFHGFSTSRQDMAPLVDEIAADFGANLFHTRLTGHGRGGLAMVDGSVNDWLNDANEALEVGRRLGDSVILIGNSTGATAATWLASIKTNTDIAAIILLSPNFSPADPKTRMLLWPWGQQLAELVNGKERYWEPHNQGHGQYWAHQYPTKAVLPVLGLVKLVNDADLENINIPTMMIYSSKDKVISIPALKQAFSRLPSAKNQLIEFNDTQDPSFHILAGDILSPSSTEQVKQQVLGFLDRAFKAD